MNSSAGNSYYEIPPNRRICKFFQRGFCKFGNRCRNIHHRQAPSDTDQGPRKIQLNGTETPPHLLNYREMEASAAINGNSKANDSDSNEDTLAILYGEQSLTKSCGICFDIIMQKKDRRKQLFGILPNCNHCFCFTCIRRWRQSKDFELEVAKGCPECRTLSEFVYPSKIWYDIKEEKERFIFKEKSRMQQIDCRYFRKGRGKCPFGNTCLYLHALPNGKKMDVGPPKPRRRRTSNNIEVEVVHEILQWVNNDEDDFFDLEPMVAMHQVYDDQDVRRIIALERLVSSNSGGDDGGSDGFDQV